MDNISKSTLADATAPKHYILAYSRKDDARPERYFCLARCQI